MDINNLLASLTGNTQQRIGTIQAQVGDMQQDTAAMRGLMDVNMQEGQKLAMGAGVAAAKEAEIQFKIDSAKERAAATIGLNEDDVNNQLVQSMAAYNSAQEAKKQTLQRYQEIQNTGLLQDPIGYILGRLELPQVVNTHNALNAQASAAADNISTRQQLLQQHKSAMVVNTAEVARDLNMKKAELGVQQAMMQLREAEIGNISKIAGRKLQEFQHSNSIFALQDAALAKQMQVAQFQMSLEERKEARAARVEAAKEKASAKAEQDAFVSQFDASAQRVSQFLGMEVPMSFTLWKNMPDSKRKQSWFETVTSGSLGEGLLDSLQFVNTQGNMAAFSQNNPGAAKAVSEISQAIEQVAAPLARRPENLKKKPEELVNEATNQYTNAITSSANDPQSPNSLMAAQWDKVFNPYKAQYKVLVDEAQAGTLPNLRNNIVVKTLTNLEGALDPQQPNLSADSEQKMLAVVAESIKKREIGLDAAAQQVSEFYTTAALKNRDLYQYDLFGLPPQTRYMAKFGTTGMFGKVVTADLMSTMSVKKALAELAIPPRKDSFLRPMGFPLPGEESEVLNVLRGQQGETK